MGLQGFAFLFAVYGLGLGLSGLGASVLPNYSAPNPKLSKCQLQTPNPKP